MVLIPRIAGVLAALSSAGCTCALSTPPLDAGADADMALDAARAEAGVDGGAEEAGQADPDSGPRDAGEPDADPNIYPCEEDSDCSPWWQGAADCVAGFCCLGFDVDGVCICGERIGGCPPGFLACCATKESPDQDVCTWWDFCDFGGPPD